MERTFKKIIQGYQSFRERYASGDNSVMQYLSHNGQQPQIMVVSCCDSRVDPALILNCDPGDLFVVRNVANIIPPYEKDEAHHGVSAALEFGVCFLKIKHLILLGHSQCGGIQLLMEGKNSPVNDFINNWVSLVKVPNHQLDNPDDYSKQALKQSLQNCLTFPWIQDKIMQAELVIHLWFFDVKKGQIFTYSDHLQEYQPLESFHLVA
jgi:carbonic anhydrase